MIVIERSAVSGAKESTMTQLVGEEADARDGELQRFLMLGLLPTRTMAEAGEENGDQGRCSG